MNQSIFCGFSGASGSYLLALTKSAERVYGISSKHLLQMSSLKPEAFGNEYLVIPVFYVANVISQILNLTGDHTLGLKLAKHIKLKAFDTLGYLLMHCETVGEGLQRIQRFERLVMEHSVTRISTDNGVVQVSWSFEHDIEPLRYFRELIVSGWVSMVQRMTHTTFSFQSIHFSHSNPHKDSDQELITLAQYEDYFGCSVYFDSNWTGVCFSEEFLNATLGNADQRLKSIMEDYAELMLSNINYNRTFVNEAKRIIYKQLLNGETDFESFAQLMHLSTRALQARFQKMGVTYGDLLDEVRRMLSLIYLEDENITILETGMLLAYTDQSSFARAFKRWTGKTPKQYRDKLEQHRLLYSQQTMTG